MTLTFVYRRRLMFVTHNTDITIIRLSVHPLPLPTIHPRHIRHFFISDTVRDRGRLRSKGPPIGNGLWRIEWSHDRWRHLTPKGQVVTLIRLERPISWKQLEMLF